MKAVFLAAALLLAALLFAGVFVPAVKARGKHPDVVAETDPAASTSRPKNVTGRASRLRG